MYLQLFVFYIKKIWKDAYETSITWGDRGTEMANRTWIGTRILNLPVN